MIPLNATTRLRSLFAPRSIAVVGASPKGGYGLTTLHNLSALGFAGDVSVVHPRHDEVCGYPAVPSLRDLDEVPDAVAVAVPAAAVPAVVGEAAELGVGGAVIYASGFGELGDEGRKLQTEVIESCSGRTVVIGPNCLGVVGYRTRAALWGIVMPPEHAKHDGVLALAAQSGNLALTLMMSGRLPSLAYAASLGNQADTDVTDCLEEYLTDPSVRVVALVIEGLRDVERFRRLALAAAERDVAVVVLKIGRSSKGQAATIAHTGTLAGSDAAYDALFEQTGVIRVDDPDELVATCSLLAAPKRPKGKSVAVFASSGGECGLVADLVDAKGLRLADLDADTKSALGELLPPFGYVTNPFDLTAGGWGQAEIYRSAAHNLAAAPDVDLVGLVGDAATYAGDLENAGWPEMIRGAGAAAADGDVPVALITAATDTHADLPALCEGHGVTMLAGLTPGMRAIALVGDRAEWMHRRRSGDTSEHDEAIDQCARKRADGARTLLAGQGEVVPETQSKMLLDLYGIATPHGGLAKTTDEAVALAEQVGYPVVCKLDADGVAHKSDLGGVELGLVDPAAVRHAAGQIMARGVAAVGDEAISGVRVERAADIDSGMELILGGVNDTAGSLVVIGAGGILTELLQDSAGLLWPFDDADVRWALSGLRIRPVLDGYRGRPGVDLDLLADQVVRVGRLLHEVPEIREIDINPLLCGLGTSAVTALDAMVRKRNLTENSERGE